MDYGFARLIIVCFALCADVCIVDSCVGMIRKFQLQSFVVFFSTNESFQLLFKVIVHADDL